MNAEPVELGVREPNSLYIVWSDGVRRVYPFAELRDRCPCASCREKRSAAPAANPFQVLSKQETQPVKVSNMTPIGNYAYSIAFNDGHDTGIFTLEFLRELGRQVDE